MTRQRIVPYLPRLFGYAFSITLDRDISRDLVQECAVRALRASRVPADEDAFRSWLFKILRNASIDQHRHATRWATTCVAVAEPDHEGACRPEDSLINRITVRNGMRRLEPAQREIMALIDISGFSYAEAADHLDIPVGTVMSRLSRARRSLLFRLQDSNVHVLPRPRTRSTR